MGDKEVQLAFFSDQTRCTGCYTYVVACKDWHDVPQGAWYDPDDKGVDRGGAAMTSPRTSTRPEGHTAPTQPWCRWRKPEIR